MAMLHTDNIPPPIPRTEERFYQELAERMPGNCSVSVAYFHQIPYVNIVTEIPLSPRMARFKKAGLLGCFDGTGVNSENYKDFI